MADYLEIRLEPRTDLKPLVPVGRLLVGPWYGLSFAVPSPELTLILNSVILALQQDT